MPGEQVWGDSCISEYYDGHSRVSDSSYIALNFLSGNIDDLILTRASITYHTSVWTQEPGSRIQDPKDSVDSVDSVDSYESVRGRIGLYKEVLTLAHCNR